MKKYIPAEHIELFHLYFLEQLNLKIDKSLYALKGGCNLRFFLKSIRYSQAIDFDVQIIRKDTLANHIRKIINSISTKRFLQANKIEIINFSEPKQTQTTQRWKISIKSSSSETLLNTKLSFSFASNLHIFSFCPLLSKCDRSNSIDYLCSYSK